MRATQNDAMRFLSRLFNEGIKPHRWTIAPITASGGIAVVVFEPGPVGMGAAQNLGWDGETAAFRLSDQQQRWIALRLLSRGDDVSYRWFTAKRDGRIFVIVHDGTLLVNVTDDGYGLEPGSTMHDPPAN